MCAYLLALLGIRSSACFLLTEGLPSPCLSALARPSLLLTDVFGSFPPSRSCLFAEQTIEDCHRKQWLLDGEQVFVEVLDTAGQGPFFPHP